MTANKTAVLTLILLGMVIIACSSISSTEDKLVGEWQSSKPKEAHLKITKNHSSSSDYYDGVSYTRGGRDYTDYWQIRNGERGTLLVLADASYWGGFSRRTGNGGMSESTRKIVELTSDRLVMEWDYPNNSPESVRDIYEFHRVK